MPMWRCPHCGTPQAETARCWVCRRSSTACGTCRHFRRSVAAQIGYCALDRRREPLVGDEIRACWEAAPVIAEPVLTASDPAASRGGVAAAVSLAEPVVRNTRDFVEVEAGAEIAAVGDATPRKARARRGTPPQTAAQADPVMPASAAAAGPPSEPGWSLWSDLEG